ncbi:hypothetical protein B5807_12045 [Epicoccum nigrum]|uniref:Uncharacterized protein n=1 Tax=Epicoccum nigrum TaxID=105696 RepID=A0A1Y2LI85_EPING|nr:hypothetical protein B5807_12045 [Epicoccum nigrum]
MHEADINRQVKKRHREPESPSIAGPIEPASKRLCFPNTAVPYIENLVNHWRRLGSWPDEYFQPDAMSNIFAQPALRRKRSPSYSFASSFSTHSSSSMSA